MKEFTIKIIGDVNDADYVTKVTDVTSEQLDLIKDILALTGKEYDASSLYSSMDTIITEGEQEFMSEFLPTGDYANIHRIESVEVAPIVTWKKIL